MFCMARSSARCVGWALACALGCSGRVVADHRTPPPAQPIAEADFSAAYTYAHCSIRERCCPGGSFDMQACQTNWQTAVPKSEPPYVTVYDPVRAGECVAVFVAARESCLWHYADDVCLRVYTGSQPIGAMCAHAADCIGAFEGKTRCQVSYDMYGKNTSACRAVEIGKAGDACIGENNPAVRPGAGKVYDKCDVGLFCNDSNPSVPSVCTALASWGQPCVWLPATETCDFDLACFGPVCAPRLPNGAACYAGVECQSRACPNHDVCTSGYPVCDVF
jgi:hypothetical protein